MDESKKLKLPMTFYLRGILLCLTLVMIGVGISYVLADESDFADIETEICNEREEITGYCIEAETVSFEKFDPIVVFLLIALLSFSTTVTYRAMSLQYKKAKYGFKVDWK
jgi:hypothetical protein